MTAGDSNTRMNDRLPTGTETVDCRVTAADGLSLAATVYGAPGNGTVVLVNAATGVPRQFYRRFAVYLQQHGWTAVTYDYRGIGGSRPASLRNFDASMRDWAFLDMTAMVDWIDRPSRS